ncbi:MAG: ferrochelatase [Planctomycetia bacterium]|nr:ferrochelatase [Planctomycetia bacterium]
MPNSYDVLIVISFGGPEGPDEVMPFLENVVRGRNVPVERLKGVAEHYYEFGGVSPINGQNRALIAALEEELQRHDIRLPIYWGNRNWYPMLADTVQKMADDGVRRALAFVTSAYSSYSGCRQYLEDIERARETVGPAAPVIDKLRNYYNHPGFLEASIARVRSAWAEIPPADRGESRLLFTAHSIPGAMATACRYEAELRDLAGLISEQISAPLWELVYQSRSGPPSQPWLGPDIGDALRRLTAEGVRSVVVAPIGFISDHLEVLYDLDTEAQALAGELGIRMVRAATVGTHPRFIAMIRELIQERLLDQPARPAVGHLGPCPDVCPAGCCVVKSPSA